MKKLLSIIICLALIVGALPMSVLNVSAETDGYYTYSVYNGKATITDVDDSISGDITIPSTLGGYPVTSIVGAFFGCVSLESVTIPDSVTLMYEAVFSDCTSLKSVTIGNGLTHIYEDTFARCTSLTSVTIPDSVTSIDSGAFSGCTSLTSVTIPDSVTSIGDFAFDYCISLTSVTIPDSVTSIGCDAFSSCRSLTSVTIGDSVKSIDDCTFLGCTSLTSITIPDSVTSIGSFVFDNCTSLTSVTIGNSVTIIGRSAFYNCTALKSVTIPDSVTIIGPYAFDNTGWYNNQPNGLVYAGKFVYKYKGTCPATVIIKEGTLGIVESAFESCSSLKSVTIPDSVTSIGESAFYGCTSLTSVTIGNSVTSIGRSAFYNCTALTSVTIPNSVTSIGWCAFYDCTSLKTVYYRGNETDRNSITIDSSNYDLTNAKWYYNSCIGATKHTYDNNCDNKCNVCEKNRQIEGHSYSGISDNFCNECGSKRPEASAKIGVSNIRQTTRSDVNGQPIDVIAVDVNISENNNNFSAGLFRIESDQGLTRFVSEKGDKNFTFIVNDHSGDYFRVLFDSVNLLGSNAEDFSLGTYYFVLPEECGTYTFSIVWIEGCAFDDSKNILDYEMTTYPDSIGYTVHFYDNACDSICNKCGFKREVPDHIYDNNCDNKCNVCNLEREVPDHVYDNIYDGDCNLCGFSYYTYTVTNGEATITDVDDSISGDITIPSKLGGYPVTSIGTSAFSGCTSLTSVTISNSITSIGESAFYGCSSLKSVNITDMAVWCNIGFGNVSANPVCYGANLYLNGELVTDLVIPDSVTRIKDYAFYGCYSITSVIIHDSVTSIGYEAFCKCYALESAEIGDGVTDIEYCAFAYCEALENLTLGNGVTTIGEGAFGCCSFKSIVIPDSVVNLGPRAFGGNTVLESVVIPDDFNVIVEGLFYHCYSLKYVNIPKGVTRIEDTAFYCTAIENIDIPDGVTSIGEFAFTGCKLNSVILPNSLTLIDECAFSNCTALTNITMPNSVTSIGERAFVNCSSLTIVFYRGSNEDKLKITIGSYNVPLTNATWYYDSCVGTAEHTFDNTCDADCNVCNLEREVPDHSYTLNKNHTCNICKYSKTPDQPTVISKTYYSVTLNAIDGFEYSKDGSTWQSSNVFTNLSPETTYTFYQRVKASETANVSDTSAALTVETDVEPTYTVVFKNWDGSVISTETYHYGDKVTVPATPSKEADNTYTYTFKGWDNEVVDCEGEATYTATYTPVYIDYTIVFKNWDGSVLSTKTYHYGDKVEAPANPTRGTDNTYTYTFAGWDKEVVNCIGNETYTATYTPIYVDYIVIFKDWDESVLSIKSYHYGDDIIAPTNYNKPADNTYTYEFAGWDSKADKCTGNAIYNATYTPVYIDYTVEFKNWDGSVISTNAYHYGDKVTVPADPTRAADSTYIYNFNGWDKEVVNCEGNATYTATYTSNYIDYTVEFKNWDGTILSTKTYHYGDEVLIPETPSKEADNTYTYTFKGWNNEVVDCAGDTTYTATYTPVYIDFTVTFKNWDGSVLSAKTYHYGDEVEVPSDPTRAADKTYAYTFVGWDKEVIDCNGNVVYTAVYGIAYLLGDLNGDGSVNTSDLATMKLFLAGANELSETDLLAGDLNGDGAVNTTDLAALKLFLAGI